MNFYKKSKQKSIKHSGGMQLHCPLKKQLMNR